MLRRRGIVCELGPLPPDIKCCPSFTDPLPDPGGRRRDALAKWFAAEQKRRARDAQGRKP